MSEALFLVASFSPLGVYFVIQHFLESSID